MFIDPEKPVKIGRVYGKKLTPKAQLWEALKSIGANLELGQEFDIDTLLGNKCRVMVEDYKDGEGKTVSGITKVKTPGTDTEEFIKEVKTKFAAADQQINSPAVAVPEEVVRGI